MPDGAVLAGDVALANRFLFEVDGVEIGVFREVAGLEVTSGVYQHREGGENGYVHKLPSGLSWPNVVFRRGITDSDNLFAWLRRSGGEQFAAGGNKLVRSTGAVTVLSFDRQRLRTWDLEGVYAVRWKGPDLSVDSTAFLEEELEIAHDGFRQRTL